MKLARLAPVLLIALVGCSPSPTVAAMVDDASIAQQRVTDLVEACPLVGQTEITDPLALQMLINMEVFYAAADKIDVELEEKQLRTMMLSDQDFGPFLAQQPDCGDLLLPEVTFNALQMSADPEKLNAALDEIEVDVNPRYGTWEDGQGIVGSGSVSVPAAEG